MTDLYPAGLTPRPDFPLRRRPHRPRHPRPPPPGAWCLSDYFVLYLSLAYFLALVPFLPTLSTPGNLTNLMSNMWPLLVVAVGQTFVLTIAGIDLSQGAVLGLTSVVAAILVATAAPASVLSTAPVWGTLLTEQGGVLRRQPLGHSHRHRHDDRARRGHRPLQRPRRRPPGRCRRSWSPSSP